MSDDENTNVSSQKEDSINNKEIIDTIIWKLWDSELYSIDKIMSNRSNTYSKSAKLIYNNTSQIRISIPKMKCPFGISSYNDNGIYQINFQVLDKEFLDKLVNFENKIIECARNKKTKDGKIVLYEDTGDDNDAIRLFSSSLKVKNPYPTNFITNIRQDFTLFFNNDNTNIDNIEFYNKDSEMYIKNIIKSGAECSAVIEPYLWKVNAKYGVKWTIYQIKIFDAPIINTPKSSCTLEIY